MFQLALYLLGPPRIELDGEPVHLDRRKAVALLAYLAVTGWDHSRDTLATLLWPELDQRRARAGLRRTLVALRNALGEGWLEADREIVRLHPDPSTGSGQALWLDVAQFRGRMAACKTHGHPPDETCPDCLPLLTEAVELYRDDFLAGFTLRDSLQFDEWQFFQTEGLRDELASALERLVRWHSAPGEREYEQAIAYARRWLALDPLHEPAHRRLMELYAQAGQQAAALRQYQLCQDTLTDELGLSPAEETTALYERIRSGVEIGSDREAPAPIPHNLLPQPTPFVGREEELATIARRLADPACRLLTLVGPGGIGKTRLAIQAAKEVVEAPPGQASFSHGVYFVSLAPLSSVDALAPTIASALNFLFHGETDPRQQLLNYLREKEMLLVLDNFEHLLAPPPSLPEGSPPSSPPEGGIERGTDLVTEVLATAPAVKILVTSRQALNLQGEWFHPVAGMRFPTAVKAEAEGAPEALEAYSAVALFAQSARRAHPGFNLLAENRPVVRICQLVEGMPLAIEMAAAWLKALSPAQIAAEIERGLDILATSLRDLPTRHRSVRAVFDHSWRLLSEAERDVLKVLSVFRGGFQTEAAEAVAGASLLALAGLVEKSLLRRTPAGRYQMHELFRQYAAEKLQEDPQEEKMARDRHSGYYAAFLQGRGEALKGRQQVTARAEIETDIENARAAWNWAVKQEQVEQLEQAIEGLCLFYEWRGRYQEGETACWRAAERLKTATAGDDLRVLAKILAWQGRINLWLGRTKRVSQLVEQSMALLERPALAEHDVRPEKAFALELMADLPLPSYREQARRLYEQSLVLYQALGDRWGMAHVLGGLGYIARHQGAYDEAKQLLKESLEIRRALGDQRGIANSLHGLASIANRQGQFEEGERLARESIKIRQEIGERFAAAHGLGLLGATHSLQGKYAASHSLLEESAGILNDLGAHDTLAWWSTWLGFAKAHLGQYKEAHVQGQMTLTIYRKAGILHGVGRSLFLLGCVALAEEACAEARELLGESVAHFREGGSRDSLASPLAWLGCAARGLGQLPQAAGHVCEALRTALEIGNRLQFLEALPAVALLLADRGEGERAVELYALASRYPRVANSRWFEDVAGKHIAAVAATLPPDVVAAAQERGRARDLWDTAVELLEELENTTQD